MHIARLTIDAHFCCMLSNEIKEATKVAHQQLEKTVVQRLKEIRSAADYASFLKVFYAYFRAVEQAIAPFVTPEVLPDYPQRRNASYLRRDIEALGGGVDELPEAVAPAISNPAEAMGALYVLEGSIMGGPYIVQMLRKYGMETGFSFFSGYGEETGSMWAAFTTALNATAQTDEAREAAIRKASETFSRFGNAFAGTVSEA